MPEAQAAPQAKAAPQPPATPAAPRHRSRPLALVLGSVVLLTPWSGAQMAAPLGLVDPTRPPPGMGEPQAAGNGGSGGNAPLRPWRGGPAAGGAAAPVAPPPPPPPLPALQSLQVNARGPATAVIDGQLVRTGDNVAGWRVMSIDSEGVVLRAGSASERLALLGPEAKQPVGSITVARRSSYQPQAAASGVAAGSPAGANSPGTPVGMPAAVAAANLPGTAPRPARNAPAAAGSAASAAPSTAPDRSPP